MSVIITKGISFPFRFGAKGRVVLSEASDYTDAHIKESITQILLTNRGERVMEPEFGSNIRDLIFTENDPSLDNIAIDFARKSLSRWEPRIEVENIEIIREYGKIYIRVNYYILSSRELTSVLLEMGGGKNA